MILPLWEANDNSSLLLISFVASLSLRRLSSMATVDMDRCPQTGNEDTIKELAYFLMTTSHSRYEKWRGSH
jgi:hypothetical protein